MKTLVVGDIHGKVEIVEKALSLDYKVIFVGDYLDDFHRSIVDQIRSLELVLEAIKTGKAIGLKGNHEISYLDDFKRCSGYNFITKTIIDTMDLSPLVDYTYAEGFLITHAGFTLQHGISFKEYAEIGNFDQIGFCRGGADVFGGIRWCDVNYDFKPTDQPQIFGHTKRRNIDKIGNSYCIDVLDYCNEALLIEDGNATVILI